MKWLTCLLALCSLAAAEENAADRVERGWTLMREGQISAGLLEFIVARRLDPDLLEAQLGYQDAKLARGRDAQLATAFEAHLARRPDDRKRQLLAARVRARPKDRVRDLAQVASANPDFYEAWLELGRAQLRSEMESQAIRSFDRAASLRPTAIEPQIGAGLAERMRGDVQAAERRFLAASVIDPEASRPYHQLAMNIIYSRDARGGIDPNNQLRAERCLLRALELSPDDYPSISSLARHYFDLRRERDARRLLLEYRERKPGDPRPAICLAEYDIAQGLCDMAETHLMNTMRLCPDEPDIYVNLGALCSTDGRLRDAVLYLEKALELHPRHSTAWLNLGHVHMTQGAFGEAVRCFESALACEEVDENEISANLARGHARLGRSMRREADELEATTGRSDATRTLQLRSLEELKESRRAYERAIEGQPEMGVLHREKGEVHLALDEGAPAIAEFQLARTCQLERPPETELDYLSACAWLIVGDLTRARDAVQRVLTLDSRHVGAIDLRRQIERASR